MTSRSASVRTKTGERRVGATPKKSARMSRLETKRLEQFKALMLKYGGKCQFGGSDE